MSATIFFYNVDLEPSAINSEPPQYGDKPLPLRLHIPRTRWLWMYSMNPWMYAVNPQIWTYSMTPRTSPCVGIHHLPGGPAVHLAHVASLCKKSFIYI